MTVLRRYTFKLYPNAAQRAEIDAQRRMCAELWNALLQMREDAWRPMAQRPRRDPDRKGRGIAQEGKSLTELRAACPEWRRIGRSTMECVMWSLDESFKAFFRRAKEGGGNAGYPRYKRAAEHGTLPYREAGRGWKMARRGPSSWAVTCQNIPGTITARGQFPADPVDFRNAEIKFHGGCYWLSVCVAMEPRRLPGIAATEVRFNLIDEFAEVKISAEGGCSACASARISLDTSGDTEGDATGCQESPAVAPDWEANSRTRMKGSSPSPPAVAPDLEANSSESQADSKSNRKRADIQRRRDRTRKRGSYRWKRDKARIARLSAREARQRAYRLHAWSTAIVAGSSALTVIKPKVAENTQSGRGNAQRWGAFVSTIAALNRAILDAAPAMAAQMLAYKAEEAGIPLTVMDDPKPVIAIGGDLKKAGQSTRAAKRVINRKAA